MITVNILESSDTIDPEDWCRPLSLMSMSGGMGNGFSFKSQYGGTPENNVKWVKVKYVFSEIWYWETVSNITKNLGMGYEFARGCIPIHHRLNMTGYSKLTTA